MARGPFTRAKWRPSARKLSKVLGGTPTAGIQLDGEEYECKILTLDHYKTAFVVAGGTGKQGGLLRKRTGPWKRSKRAREGRAKVWAA